VYRNSEPAQCRSLHFTGGIVLAVRPQLEPGPLSAPHVCASVAQFSPRPYFFSLLLVFEAINYCSTLIASTFPH